MKICKGTNCNASAANGYRHSSECRFEYAAAVASGIKEVRLVKELADSVTHVQWRGEQIKLVNSERITAARQRLAALLDADTYDCATLHTAARDLLTALEG